MKLVSDGINTTRNALPEESTFLKLSDEEGTKNINTHRSNFVAALEASIQSGKQKNTDYIQIDRKGKNTGRRTIDDGQEASSGAEDSETIS